MAQSFYQAAAALPAELSDPLSRLDPEFVRDVTEIRLRTFGPVMLRKPQGVFFLNGRGVLTSELSDAKKMSEALMNDCFHALCGYSVHSAQPQINQGYLTLSGGHRVGVCGTMKQMPDQSYFVQEIAGINIRIARNAMCELPHFLEDAPREGILIAGEPASGKTTLLRSLVRWWARTCCVSVVDERQELFPAGQMRPLDCDVFSGYPKHIGMQHALRAFSPQVLVCDEIGAKEDAQAVCSAVNAGVCVVASVHAADLDGLYKREPIRMLLETGAFTKAAFLKGRASPGQVRDIYDLDVHSESAGRRMPPDAGRSRRNDACTAAEIQTGAARTNGGLPAQPWRNAQPAPWPDRRDAAACRTSSRYGASSGV